MKVLILLKNRQKKTTFSYSIQLWYYRALNKRKKTN